MQKENQATAAVLARHGDKGTWRIDYEALDRGIESADFIRAETLALIKAVLKEEFPDWKETPLTFEGMQRSIRLGDELFWNKDLSPDGGCVVVFTDSGKPRAQLTRALASERLSQLLQFELVDESRTIPSLDKKAPDFQEKKNHLISSDQKTVKQGRMEVLYEDAADMVKMLADSNDKTFDPYAEMIAKEGVSESEAIARWINAVNQPNANISSDIHPKEAAERYRTLIQTLRERVTSDEVPVVLVGIGHSGLLAQIRHEESGGKQFAAEDTPMFCEMFRFDEKSALIGTEKINV